MLDAVLRLDNPAAFETEFAQMNASGYEADIVRRHAEQHRDEPVWQLVLAMRQLLSAVDLAGAVALFRSAAEQGVPHAHYMLGQY